MASAKKSAPAPKKSAPAKAPAKAPAAKAPAKSAPKAAAKPAPTPAPKSAPAAKPSFPPQQPQRMLVKAPSFPLKKGGAPATVPSTPETPPAAPIKLEKHAGRDTLAQIEIVKEGHFFIARTQTDGGSDKEYKNTVFEDLLTEMIITLQEQLADR